jgi:HlyD family secretion protein
MQSEDIMMRALRVVPFVLLAAIAGCSGNHDGVIEASGTIEGTDVNVGAEVSGKVLTVAVREGARVSPRDTLVVIDDTDYQLQLQQAAANAEAAAAQYRLALEGSRSEDVIQADANLRAAETDYLRMKTLLASQTVTQKQYDDAYAKFVTAQQTYEKLSRGLRKEEILTARARNEQAAAQAEYLRKKVRDCRIVAPSAGTVTLRAVEPGELVAPGMNVLRLTYLDRVKLTIYVNEAEVGRISLGQKAQVFIDGKPATPFNGDVTYISPVAEFTPKNVQTKEERTKLVFAVRIEVDNPDGSLKPGLPADARITVAQETTH